MTHTQDTLSALKVRFGEAIEEVVEFRGDTTVVVQRAAILDVLRFLKETPGLEFTFLAAMTVVDDWPEEPRFNVLYQLRQLTLPSNLRLKVRVPGDDPSLPTCTNLYLNANWHEREIYDLFGIEFAGHPDLRRILMPSDWEGHPLRKDYPLGYEEVEFTFNFDEIEKKKPYAKE
jgi:NADH-quinone oxidoreductase subunit C